MPLAPVSGQVRPGPGDTTRRPGAERFHRRRIDRAQINADARVGEFLLRLLKSQTARLPVSGFC
jgi:hypothetical protein